MADGEFLPYADPDRQQPRSRTFRRILLWGIVLMICAGAGYGFYLRQRPVVGWRGGSPPGRTQPPASPQVLHQLQAAALVETNARNQRILYRDTAASDNGDRSGIMPSPIGPWFTFLFDPNVHVIDKYSMSDDTVYMGLRHAPDGVDRLVVVMMSDRPRFADPSNGKIMLSLQCIVMTPATPNSAPQRIRKIDHIAEFQTPILDLRTLYTGLSDLSDPARFSIRLDHGVATSVLRGRLTARDTIAWSIDPGGTAILAQDSDRMGSVEGDVGEH